MQLLSEDAIVFLNFKFSKKFWPQEHERNAELLKSAQTLLFHSPAQTTTHSPELIFHIMKSRDHLCSLICRM